MRRCYVGKPDAARSCPSGLEGAGRKRTSVRMQRAALPPYASQWRLVLMIDRCVGMDLSPVAFGVLRDLPKSHKGTMWEGGL